MDVDRAQAVAAGEASEPRRPGRRPAELAQHALGVVARRPRFAHHGFAGRVEPCQQDRRLELRAGDPCSEVDPLQRLASADAQRRMLAVIRIADDARRGSSFALSRLLYQT